MPSPRHAGALPGDDVVEGREFENQDQFDLGTVPFTAAFAESCNTTFIQQALPLPDDALAARRRRTASARTGSCPVGVFSGSVPADSTGTTKAAERYRQGQVLMSPRSWRWSPAGVAAARRSCRSRSWAPTRRARAGGRTRRCCTRCGR